MAPSATRKRRIDDSVHGKISRPKKKFKKQLEYHSSSSEDEDAEPHSVNRPPGQSGNDKPSRKPKLSKDTEIDQNQLSDKEEDKSDPSASENDSDSSSDADSSIDGSDADSTVRRKKVSKRNDPTAFSTSISKILGTKLSTSARADPLLSRSKSTAQVTADIANEKLEKRARAKLRAEKKEELERGRVKDVMGVERGEAGETAELEKRLRKTAQRGVVKLFNAVRAAQVRGEEVAREERRKRSTVGMDERDKKVNEVSKQGFLELINGKGGKKVTIEEA